MKKHKSFIFLFVTLLITYTVFYAHNIGHAAATDERIFKHVSGEFDFNGTVIIGAVHRNLNGFYAPGQVEELMRAQNLCKEGRNCADCRLETIANRSESDPLIHALRNRIEKAENQTDWKPYVSGTFVDPHGNTILHKLAEKCDAGDDEDLLSVIAALDAVAGPNYTIPYSAKNALSKQSVFMQGTSCVDGGHISPSAKNKNGETARDIINKKLEKHRANWWGYSSNFCYPCQQFDRYLGEMEQKEKDEQSIRDFFNKGYAKKPLISDVSSCKGLQKIEKDLKNTTRRALDGIAQEWDISQNKIDRVSLLAKEEHRLVFEDIAGPNEIYGSPKHDQGFPVDLADSVFGKDNIDISNVGLERHQNSYVNNALGENCAFATANYYVKPAYVENGRYTFVDEVHTPVVAIYPEFDTLSPEEQVIVMAHEETHLTEGHCSIKGLLYDAIQDQHKISTVEIHQSRSAQKWQAAHEKEANILPAVRRAEMAKICLDVCNSNQNRVLSSKDCALIKRIDELHKEQSKKVAVFKL